MTPSNFMYWLYLYLADCDKNHVTDLEQVKEIASKLRTVVIRPVQLEIQFPPDPDSNTKTVWVSDSTSGKDTFSIINYNIV